MAGVTIHAFPIARSRGSTKSNAERGGIVTDRQAPDWDPRDQLVLEDQRAAYDGMRERCPVARSEFLGWSL